MEVFNARNASSMMCEGTQQQFNAMGIRSGVAQELTGPISSMAKLHDTQHTVILYFDSATGTAMGFLKYGRKDLFFYKKDGAIVQCSPVCLLDFYVDESLQRRGVGSLLFRRMMEEVGGDANPCDLAYDRPSPKLIGFMKKHFALAKPDLQPNRFTIFEGFPL